MKNILISSAIFGALISTSAFAGGDQAFTYEATYMTRKAVALRSGPGEGTGARMQLAKGAKGIVLRYCAPEFSTGTWYFASNKNREKLLSESVCEVGYKGKVGFLNGKDLAFD